jgi:CheY-like chemotaxis protein
MSPQQPRAALILLIEDSPGDLELTTRDLRRSGWPVWLVSFEEAAAALAWLRSSMSLIDVNHALVLSDRPGLVNGLPITDALAAEGGLSNIPVVILTGSTELAAREVATWAHKPIGVLAKPLDLAALWALAESVLSFPPELPRPLPPALA